MTFSDTDVQTFAATPSKFFGHSWYAMQHLPAKELGCCSWRPCGCASLNCETRFPC